MLVTEYPAIPSYTTPPPVFVDVFLPKTIEGTFRGYPNPLEFFPFKIQSHLISIPSISIYFYKYIPLINPLINPLYLRYAPILSHEISLYII
jgi:hypothetical protein